MATTGTGSVTEARRAAAEILADMRHGEMLDPAFELRAVALDARDRRWLQELVYGMLRRRAMLDAMLSERVRGGLVRLDPDLGDLLRLGAYQLLHMRSVPAYAAITQTVELTKERHGLGASKLANAVLRRLDRESDALEVAEPTDPVDALALRHSHPRWLVARWVGRWGAEETERLLAANNAEAPLVVRPYNIVREQLEATLESVGVEVTDAPLARDSLAIKSPVSLTELGAYRQGLFFVQDPGATLVTQYAALPAGGDIADLCAAPGGKALELARTGAVVVGLDRSLQRLQRLIGNAARVDARTMLAVVADARAPAIRPVDTVLLDVPCTGTGTFRRHPDARWRLKVSDLAVLAATQRSMLRAAASVVKPGGLLVYSTCTLEPPPEGTVPAAVLDAGRLRVLPQRHGVDGAFAARLRRMRG